MSYVRRSDARDRHVAAVGADKVEAGKAHLLARVRAHRLAEMRGASWSDPARGGRGDGRVGGSGQPDRVG